jgi:hypothetical protein
MGGGWNNTEVVVFLYQQLFGFPQEAGRTTKEVGVPENTPHCPHQHVLRPTPEWVRLTSKAVGRVFHRVACPFLHHRRLDRSMRRSSIVLCVLFLFPLFATRARGQPDSVIRDRQGMQDQQEIEKMSKAYKWNRNGFLVRRTPARSNASLDARLAAAILNNPNITLATTPTSRPTSHQPGATLPPATFAILGFFA